MSEKLHLDVTKYRRPNKWRIERRPETEKLYALEDRLHKALNAVAEERGKVSRLFGENRTLDTDLYGSLIPQALFDLLDSYDRKAAYLAAKHFVEHTERACEIVGEPR